MAISVAQRGKGGNPASANTIAVAFGSNVTATNAIIAVGVSDGADTTMSAISDTRSSVYNLATTLIKTGGLSMKVWIAYGITAGANTVTLTTGFNDSDLFIFEVAGLAASSAYDKTISQVQPSATAITSTTAPLTTFANELLLGISGNINTAALAYTLGASYSNLQQQDTNFANAASEERIVSSTGTYEADFTLAANTTNTRTAIFTFADTPVPIKQPTMLNNYQFIRVGDGMSTSEKFR